LTSTISRGNRGVPAPLSFAQQRLWVLDQIDGDSSQYNLPSALRLTGRLDRVGLHQALNALVERHEVLRTRYVDGEILPMQVVHDMQPVEIASMIFRACRSKKKTKR